MERPALNGCTWQYKLEGNYEGMVPSSGIKQNNTWSNIVQPINKLPKNIINTIYYKTNLPSSKIGDPHLLFQTNDQAFEIYVDNKLIYSFGDFKNFNHKHSPGSPTHLIPLPENYQNKELLIVMKSTSAKRLGLVRTIELDTKGNHFMRIFKMSISTLILGCLSLVIGIACMLVGIMRRLGRKALFSLGSIFIVVGLWGISENALTQLFHLRPIFWYYTAVVSFYLIPVSVYRFIRDISKTNKKIISLLIRLHIILFIVSFLIDLTGIAPLIDTMMIYYILTGFSYSTCVFISMKTFLKTRGKELIYIVGLIVFGVFGLYDILGWYYGIIDWKTNMTPWGMFIFQLALIYVMTIHLKEMQDRFELYREKIKVNNFKIKEAERQIDKAIENDKIKTEFFANVSHELRTPVNIIYSTLQLIKIYNDKDMLGKNEVSIKRYINIMYQNCHRLMKLVNNIIDITKIESGFYKLDLKRVNIVSLVENITQMIESYAADKEVCLIFDTEIEEKEFICDPEALERIILNLLSNAIKFTEKGDSIFVRVKEQDDNIVIEVEDTGIGIPKDKTKKVFDRFMQVDKSFTRQNEGCGIGLAIVRALVEMHNGSIELVSEIDKGSVFRIILPEIVDESTPIETIEDIQTSENKTEKVAVEFSDIYNNK